MTTMTLTSKTETRRAGILSRVGDFFANLRSAGAVAAAVEAKATPRASDLARLGIDPVAFAQIRRA